METCKVRNIISQDGKSWIEGVYKQLDKNKGIIISLTAKIEVGDWYYNDNTRTIEKATSKTFGFYRILALPEQFSPKELQAIVDGKMKDGDKVLVECEFHHMVTFKDEFNKVGVRDENHIKLNSQGHVTIHRNERLEQFRDKYINNKIEEKMYTKEEVYNFILNATNNALTTSFADQVFNARKWFEQNVK